MSAGSLFAGFARVGLLGFGGGPAMIPLMQAECVGAGWVTEAEFLEGLAVGNALPGPIAVKMAWYVGAHESGLWGGVAAVVGVTLPSVALMAGLASWIMRYRNTPAVTGALAGARPAVVGMLLFVALDLAPAGIGSATAAAIALATVAALWMRVHPGIVMLAAMGLGMLLFRGGA